MKLCKITREISGKFQQLCSMHFRSIYEVNTSVLTIMFIHNDVQCNILNLLNSRTRVCVFLKNYTNVKFSVSIARTAKKTLKIAKIAPKWRFLHNYKRKEKKRDLCGKWAIMRAIMRSRFSKVSNNSFL